MSSVLDASILIQAIHSEPGFDTILPRLEAGRVSAITMAEAANVLVRHGFSATDALAALNPLCRHLIPFTDEHARMVPLLREKARSANLSLGDLACLAVAKVERAPILTNDRAWADHDLGIRLEFGRPAGKRPS